MNKLIEFRAPGGNQPHDPARYNGAPSCNVLFWSAQSGFLSLFSAAALARWSDGQFGVYAAGSTTNDRERDRIDRFIRRHGRFGRMVAPAHQMSWSSNSGPRINVVILLDSNATFPVPTTHTPPLFVDWGLPDPLREEHWPEDLDARMNQLAVVLERRVRLLSCMRVNAYDHDAMMQRLDEIREFNPLEPAVDTAAPARTGRVQHSVNLD